MTATLADTVDISVVIPAYNEADYLGATLRSLAGQDFPGRVEVIVVDNGSTDATAELARSGGAQVVREPQRGVCAARQLGTDVARGSVVVSTDADTVHPPDWLSGLWDQLQANPAAVAVGGPCRYADPPWWATVFPPLWFAAVGAVHGVSGRVGYLTATNVAFRRAGFPGYDTTLTQGGDEVELLLRLQQWGPVLWDGRNAVTTSSRRMHQGLPHTLVVSFGYHYLLGYLVNRRAARPLIGPAPALRRADARRTRELRRRWRVGLAGTAAVATAVLARRLARTTLR